MKRNEDREICLKEKKNTVERMTWMQMRFGSKFLRQCHVTSRFDVVVVVVVVVNVVAVVVVVVVVAIAVVN